MAGTIKGITIEIDGETTKLSKALSNVNKDIKTTSTALKDVDKLLKLDPGNVGVLAKKQELLARAIEKSKEKLDALKQAQEAAQKALANGDLSQEEYEKLELDVLKAEVALKKLEEEADDSGEALEDAGDSAEEAGDAVEEAGDKAEKSASGGWSVLNQVLADIATKAIQEATNAIKGFAEETLQTGMQFETSMDKVGALSGASAEEMQLLEETARAFGATTQYSAAEAADALGYMALAGWDAQTSADNLGGVLSLAAASGMGLAEASDMVTDYLSAFSNTAMTSAEMADMLAFAQANSNTSASQLGEAYKNCAANLNAAGQDFQTTTAFLEAMANQGLKGSEAGTALNATMRDITKKMFEVKDAAEASAMAQEGLASITGDLNDLIGVQSIQIGDLLIPVADAEGNFRDLTDIMKDVETATNGLGDAEKAAALQSTFTADSTKAVNLIMAEGVDNIEGYEDALRKCDGAAEDMADTMTDNLGGDVKEMGSAFEELQLKIMDGLNEPLRNIVQTITSEGIPAMENIVAAVGEFGSWCSENQPIVEGIAIAVGSIAAAMAIYNTYVAISTALTAAKAAADAAGATSLLAYAAAQAAALAPMILITAAIAAVIAIIVVCIRHWDEIKAAVSNAVSNMKKAVTEKLDAAKEKVKDFVDAAKEKFDSFKEKVEGIKEKVSDMASSVKDKFEDVKEKVKDAIDKVKGFLSGELKFPHIKVPHFSISGGVIPWGIGGAGTKPTVSVSWYKKAMDRAMILNRPTIFGSMGSELLGAGEAGREVVAGESHLIGLIGQSINNSLGVRVAAIEDLLVEYLPQAANTQVVLDNGVLVGQMSGRMNKQINTDSRMQRRGVR